MAMADAAKRRRDGRCRRFATTLGWSVINGRDAASRRRDGRGRRFTTTAGWTYYFRWCALWPLASGPLQIKRRETAFGEMDKQSRASYKQRDGDGRSCAASRRLALGVRRELKWSSRRSFALMPLVVIAGDACCSTQIVTARWVRGAGPACGQCHDSSAAVARSPSRAACSPPPPRSPCRAA